jgi:hypothetical protein
MPADEVVGVDVTVAVVQTAIIPAHQRAIPGMAAFRTVPGHPELIDVVNGAVSFRVSRAGLADVLERVLVRNPDGVTFDAQRGEWRFTAALLDAASALQRAYWFCEQNGGHRPRRLRGGLFVLSQALRVDPISLAALPGAMGCALDIDEAMGDSFSFDWGEGGLPGRIVVTLTV